MVSAGADGSHCLQNMIKKQKTRRHYNTHMRYRGSSGLTGIYTPKIKLYVEEVEELERQAQPPSALLRDEMGSRDLNCQLYCNLQSVPLLNCLLHFCVYGNNAKKTKPLK